MNETEKRVPLIAGLPPKRSGFVTRYRNPGIGVSSIRVLLARCTTLLQETTRTLREGWLATGDVATVDGEGYFAIVDRRKGMINTAGFKVWPREVEETLYAHEAVEFAMVIGVPDDYRGEAVKACVVVKDACRGRVSEADLADFRKSRLTTYKVPRTIEFRDAPDRDRQAPPPRCGKNSPSDAPPNAVSIVGH
jgi:acyl-CoA synthetase (AMP-forming)/AMP-acid ligase II